MCWVLFLTFLCWLNLPGQTTLPGVVSVVRHMLSVTHFLQRCVEALSFKCRLVTRHLTCNDIIDPSCAATTSEVATLWQIRNVYIVIILYSFFAQIQTFSLMRPQMKTERPSENTGSLKTSSALLSVDCLQVKMKQVAPPTVTSPTIQPTAQPLSPPAETKARQCLDGLELLVALQFTSVLRG